MNARGWRIEAPRHKIRAPVGRNEAATYGVHESIRPLMKEPAALFAPHQTRDILHHALMLKTTAGVKLYTRQQLRKTTPDLSLLDTF